MRMLREVHREKEGQNSLLRQFGHCSDSENGLTCEVHGIVQVIVEGTRELSQILIKVGLWPHLLRIM